MAAAIAGMGAWLYMRRRIDPEVAWRDEADILLLPGRDTGSSRILVGRLTIGSRGGRRYRRTHVDVTVSIPEIAEIDRAPNIAMLGFKPDNEPNLVSTRRIELRGRSETIEVWCAQGAVVGIDDAVVSGRIDLPVDISCAFGEPIPRQDMREYVSVHVDPLPAKVPTVAFVAAGGDVGVIYQPGTDQEIGTIRLLSASPSRKGTLPFKMPNLAVTWANEEKVGTTFRCEPAGPVVLAPGAVVEVKVFLRYDRQSLPPPSAYEQELEVNLAPGQASPPAPDPWKIKMATAAEWFDVSLVVEDPKQNNTYAVKWKSPRLVATVNDQPLPNGRLEIPARNLELPSRPTTGMEPHPLVNLRLERLGLGLPHQVSVEIRSEIKLTPATNPPWLAVNRQTSSGAFVKDQSNLNVVAVIRGPGESTQLVPGGFGPVWANLTAS